MAEILVVDDAAVSRDLLATVLVCNGHTVTEAADGIEALRMIEKSRPQLIISDLLMPNMGGYVFIQRLRAQPGGQTIPVLFYSASYQRQEALDAIRGSQMCDFLPKPSSTQLLLERVEALLATKQVAEPLSAEFNDQHQQWLMDSLARASEEIEELTASLAEARRRAENAERARQKHADMVRATLRTPLEEIVALLETVAETPCGSQPADNLIQRACRRIRAHVRRIEDTLGLGAEPPARDVQRSEDHSEALCG